MYPVRTDYQEVIKLWHDMDHSPKAALKNASSTMLNWDKVSQLFFKYSRIDRNSPFSPENVSDDKYIEWELAYGRFEHYQEGGIDTAQEPDKPFADFTLAVAAATVTARKATRLVGKGVLPSITVEAYQLDLNSHQGGAGGFQPPVPSNRRRRSKSVCDFESARLEGGLEDIPVRHESKKNKPNFSIRLKRVSKTTI
ncbi:MAG: hypothetical protein P0S95_01935 [Rhabdochlamydiaceae bacterium]|nr:hypothetical protein [Candidatus Amphrikana amoebophyrae]